MPDTQLHIQSQLAWAAAELAASGIDTPQLDAQLLMSHVTGLTRTQLITRSQQTLSEAQAEHFHELVAKRRERCPLPYLIGVWEFWGMQFEVNPSTLIPRPETEILVETCVEWLRERECVMADIGTGTGAIAVALAEELADSYIYAVEISPEAASTAKRNADRNRVGDRVEVLTGDLAAPLYERELQGKLDAIVSNPPYIADETESVLQPEVQQEPRSATMAGPDPLLFYRRIITETADLLKPDGRIFFEIDPGLSEGIIEFAAEHGFNFVELRNDLAGFERVLVLECGSAK